MRTYSVNLVGGTLTAAITTLIEILAHTNRSIILTRAWITQQANTTSAQQAVTIRRQSTSGTNVSTPNINPYDVDDAAAGFTAKGLITTLGTGTAILYTDSFNWQNGWLWLPVPEERILVTGAGIVGLHLPVAPPAQTVNCGIDAIEVG